MRGGTQHRSVTAMSSDGRRFGRPSSSLDDVASFSAELADPDNATMEHVVSSVPGGIFG